MKLDTEVETREGMAAARSTADQALTHDSDTSLGGLQGCLGKECKRKWCCVYVNGWTARIHKQANTEATLVPTHCTKTL